MQPYKADFIEFLVRAGVLTFGDFTTKSGRKTPYFINTGNYRTGGQLGRLGGFYARALIEHWGKKFDNLYGPAYKGIPLAVTAGIALSADFAHDVSITYNRKEVKDHGERGGLIGHKYNGGERIIIVEDVITAGTSIRETLALLAENNNPRVVGVIVSVDRMERGQGQKSAIEEIQAEFDIPVFSIVNVREIIDYLFNRSLDDKIYVDWAMKQRMEAYLTEYGVEAKSG